MNIASFLTELRRLDVRVWVEGDRLRCDAPPGVLTPALRERLQTGKADLIEFLQKAEALHRQQRAIVPLQARGRRLPLFAVSGHNGDVFSFRILAGCLGPEQPFYGLQPPGADGRGEPLASIEAMAAYFAGQLRAFRPEGPYLLAGFCAGGTVALELAQQLRRGGAEVGLLALIASPHPREFRPLPKARRYLKEQWQRARKHAPALLLPLAEQSRYFAQVLGRHRAYREAEERRLEDPLLAQRARIQRTTLAALARYRPAPYPDPVHLFLPEPEWIRPGGLAARWQGTAPRIVEHYGPAGSNTDDMLGRIHGPVFAEILRRCLDGLQPSRNRPQARPPYEDASGMPSPQWNA